MNGARAIDGYKRPFTDTRLLKTLDGIEGVWWPSVSDLAGPRYARTLSSHPVRDFDSVAAICVRFLVPQ